MRDTPAIRMRAELTCFAKQEVNGDGPRGGMTALNNLHSRLGMWMRTRLTRSAVAAIAARCMMALAAGLSVTACVVYEPVPAYGSPVTKFERSWNAAVGAMQDQGVEISSADRASGVIRGRRGGIDVVASLGAQADGSVRVQFNSSGATSQDPALLDRVSRSYEVRMGRY